MPTQLLDAVLSPDTLLQKLDALERQRSEQPEHAQLAQDHYVAIRDALHRADFRAAATSASSVRALGDESRPPATVYLHPHAALSQFQSVITYCFEAELEDAGHVGPDVRGVRRWFEELEERLRRYGPCDVRWIEPKLLELISNVTHSKHPFPDLRPGTVALGDRAKVVVVGDWATGLPQARNVARSIRAHLEAAEGAVECHVIHLGDTYYSGTEDEYHEWFLPLWPVELGSSIKSWSLNGNHDMYAGGHGYFEALLRDERFAAQGGSSYFCLGNEHWRFVGLDDSYTDPDAPQLAGSQVDWVGKLVNEDGPGTILLTHHQPFSAWEVVGSALAGQVAQAVGDRRIEAWLWGHEHRAAVYEPGINYRAYHDLAQYTAVIGHGGVPNLVSGPEVTRPQDAVDQSYLRWENTDYYTVAADTWSYGGFAVIDIDGPTATMQFYTEIGDPRTDEHGVPVAADPIARV